MIVQYFLSAFLFVFYFLPICSVKEQPATSGPFKTSIVSVSNCRSTQKPYVKNPPIVFYPVIQNIGGKNMLAGNLTIYRDTKDAKVRIKSSTWRDGKFHQTHSFNNLDCHGALLHFTFTAFKIKYEKKTCMFFKGVYPFKDMDVNKLQHIWVSTMPYGRLVWRSEIFTAAGMFSCQEFDTITEASFYG